MTLNKDEIIKTILNNKIIKIISEHEVTKTLSNKIKENPLHAVIAGVIIFIFFILILTSLVGGSGDSQNGSSYKTKKGPLRISIAEAGSIQAREKIIVKNEVEGNTSIIFIIEEGINVKKGDLLVELDSSNLEDQKIDQEIRVQNADAAFVSARENLAVTENQAESDVDKAQLAFDFAKQDLDKYIKGEYPNQLMQAESNITLAEEEHARAKEKVEWSQKLYTEKYLSQMEMQADELSEKQKKLKLELAQNELDLFENFTHKRQIDQLESDVRQAEMALERVTRKARADIVQAEANLKAKEAEFNRQKDKLEKIETQIEKTKIYAPADGLALYATSEQRGGGRFGRSEEPLDEGSNVRERQELIHLPTTSGFNAEIGIYEASLDKVRTGLPVLITADALPEERFRGKVVSVSPVPDAETSFLNPDLKIYTTIIEVQNGGNIDLLKSGMSCTAEIIVEQHKEAVYIPVQAVIRVNGKPTVFMADGGDLEPREVEIGLDNNRMIHIKGGLKEGEVVSLTPPLMQAEVTDDENVLIEDITIDPAPAQSERGMGANPEPQRDTDQSSGFGGPPGDFGGGTGNMPMLSPDSMIGRMDQDGDGRISQSELPPMFADRFSQMDKNGDGFIEADEFEFPSPGEGGFGGFGDDTSNRQRRSPEEMMQRADQDGDGKISQEEFRGTSEMFDQMDKNGDGYLEADEFDFSSMRGRNNSGGGFGQQSGGMQEGGFGDFPGESR